MSTNGINVGLCFCLVKLNRPFYSNHCSPQHLHKKVGEIDSWSQDYIQREREERWKRERERERETKKITKYRHDERVRLTGLLCHLRCLGLRFPIRDENE